MRRRDVILSGFSTVTLTGCVSVNSEVEGTQPPPSDTPTTTTIDAGGGAGDAIAENDLVVVQRALADEINILRDQIDGAPPLSTEGSLPMRLQRFAEDHTNVMHAVGRVAIDLDDSDLLANIDETNCSVKRDDIDSRYYGEDIVIVDSIDTSGRSPRDIAEALVARWLEQDRPRRLVLADEARYVGIGLGLRGKTLLLTVIFC